jgi:hypothetical protein
MTPSDFCDRARRDLLSYSSDEAWVRGALGVCEMYASTDVERFGTILEALARGSSSLALSEGARWLLPRWRDHQR